MAGAFTVPYRAVRAGLLVAFTLVAAPAAAHNPAVPLGVLSAGTSLNLCAEAAGGALPLLIRTNIGFARARTDGTYAFGCPTLWSASEGGATLSARAESGLLGVVGNQRLSLSTDGACSFFELPAIGGRQVFDLAGGRDAIWFLERGGADPSESRLGRATDCTDDRLQGPWTDTLPDTAREGDCGAERCVFVSGARPSPSLWFAPTAALGEALRSGGSTLSLWRQIALPDGLDAQRLAVRASGDGLLWVAVTYAEGRDLLRFREAADGFSFVQRDAAVVFGSDSSDELFGPVLAEGAWVTVAGTDLRLLSPGAAPDRAWQSVGAAPVSCLDEAGGSLFVCNNFYEVSRLDLPVPGTPVSLHRVFAVDLMQGPDLSCLGAEEAAACEADWIHLGGENALPVTPARNCAYGLPPLRTPPAEPQLRDPGSSGEVCGPLPEARAGPGDGCAAASGAQLMPAFLLLLLLRRRRA